MIDFRDREPEAMRLERIEVREKIAAAYVKGKAMGSLMADQRCRRARAQALIVGVALGLLIAFTVYHYGVTP